MIKWSIAVGFVVVVGFCLFQVVYLVQRRSSFVGSDSVFEDLEELKNMRDEREKRI